MVLITSVVYISDAGPEGDDIDVVYAARCLANV